MSERIHKPKTCGEYERVFTIRWSKERGINKYMAFDVQNALRYYFKDKSIKVEVEKK